MKIIDNDSHYWLVGSAHSARPTSVGYVKLKRWIMHFYNKMHLIIMEETEWDAAGELGYMNMRILYFNALA